MDAFDLFKKLTRGAKFSTPNKVSEQVYFYSRVCIYFNLNIFKTSQRSVVKTEIDENNVIRLPKNSVNEKTNSHTLTLLSSLRKDEEHIKNKRKRKHDDDSTIERKKRLLEEERVN